MTKEKKNKSHENTIGKIIYGFLLFMPLIAICTTILINTFNNQAKTENKINYKYETNDVNNINDLIEGKIYHCQFNNITEGFYLTNVTIIKNDSTFTQQINSSGNIEFIPMIYFDADTNTINIYDKFLNTNRYGERYINVNFDFVMGKIYPQTASSLENNINIFSKCENIPIESIENKNLDNLFYSSINKVEESNLFNWAKETETYEVINTTTTLLGIENTFIDMLLTYWLLISIIYLIYDIGLMAVHIAHNKIHDLEGSI